MNVFRPFRWLVLPLCSWSALCGSAAEPGVAAVEPAMAGSPASPEAEGDFTIGPEYASAAELTVAEGVARGTVHEFVMNSADSAIYPGLKGPYERKVQVYVPAGYAAGKVAPLLVVQDGLSYAKRLVPTLDNLIAQKKLPPLVAVMINSGGGDGRGSERGLEYDTVSERYTTFVETEVLPKISRDFGVTLTSDPEGRATMGGSSGAACAFTMAWFRPDLYHRVLSYSGTFVDQQSPPNPESPHGAWEYHEHLIPQAPAKPLRLWLQVGERDNGFNRPEESLHNWVLANQRMAAALKAKGYHYRYEFSLNAGHVDGKVVGQTLPGALLWLWRGYADQ